MSLHMIYWIWTHTRLFRKTIPREWVGEPSEYFFLQRVPPGKSGKASEFFFAEWRVGVGKILKSAHFRFGQNSAGDECCCQLECCSPQRMHQDGQLPLVRSKIHDLAKEYGLPKDLQIARSHSREKKIFKLRNKNSPPREASEKIFFLRRVGPGE